MGDPRLRSPATPVALGYVVLAALWILLSDWAASLLASPRRVQELQTIKGWLFVGVTGALLWVVLHGYWRARLRAQERQTQAEHWLQSALESLRAAILQLEAKEPYRLVSATDAITELAGYTPRELISPAPRSALELVHPDDRRLVFTATRASAMDGREFVLEFRLLERDGGIRWVWCKGRPLPRRDAVELFLTDVSRLKQLEAQLVEAHALEALAELAAGVAHDVNNLLTAVIGYGELVEQWLRGEGPKAEPARASLSAAKQAAHRASSLNQRLMRLGRPPVAESQQVDLNELVNEATVLLRPMLLRRVALACEPAPDPVLVRGDPNQIVRILVNLGVNARDAMPDGGTVTLGVSKLESDPTSGLGSRGTLTERFGCLRVGDSGIGIPEEHIERIFDPFFTTKEGGSGLGLAVVAGLVEQNGGRILVESAPGEGTTFRVLLPLAGNGDRWGASGGKEGLGRLPPPVWGLGSPSPESAGESEDDAQEPG